MDFEIRKDRTKPQGQEQADRGSGRHTPGSCSRATATRKRAGSSVSTTRTGQKWRNGRQRRPEAGRRLPPIDAVAPPSGPSRYLREDDRIHIADRLREKATVRAIAAELGRSPSTVSREIRRNRTTGTRGQWPLPPARGPGPRRRPPAPPQAREDRPEPELRDFIQDHLDDTVEPGADLSGSAGTVSPTGRRCTWSTRRSTRPSTSRAEASCAASWPALCAPDGPGASPAARPSSASPASPHRWS